VAVGIEVTNVLHHTTVREVLMESMQCVHAAR